MQFNKEDYNFTEKPIVGLALKIRGGSIDSYGNAIDGNTYYQVGKHKQTGQVVIMPTDQNQKHDFINDVMRKQHKFN